MTEQNPTAAVPEDAPISVVYDIFAETATHLSARYVRLSNEAGSEEERRGWWGKVIELRDEKEAVGADDRAALTAKTAAWTARIRELDETRRG